MYPLQCYFVSLIDRFLLQCSSLRTIFCILLQVIRVTEVARLQKLVMELQQEVYCLRMHLVSEKLKYTSVLRNADGVVHHTKEMYRSLVSIYFMLIVIHKHLVLCELR